MLLFATSVAKSIWEKCKTASFGNELDPGQTCGLEPSMFVLTTQQEMNDLRLDLDLEVKDL